ncbi:MAG: MFS transporter [Actinomycetia bacterium]|nr:MFS transporter [Actinomycetes bacterium]
MRDRRDFLRVWSGQAVSNLGDGIQRVAVLWWAQKATGSNTVVVMVALATALPGLVAAPFSGWLVDRVSRRLLMLASDAIRCVAGVVLAIAAATDALSTSFVIAVAVVAALATSVFDPALQASITLLVAEDRRASANSMMGANRAVAGIVGPATGGVLIGLAGTAAALWVDAATFALSFALIALSRIPMPVVTPESADDGGLAAGFRVLRRDRQVRDLVVVAAGLNLCVAPVPVLIVGLAAGPLHLGGSGFGILMAAVPTGLLLGLAVAPRFARNAPAALWALLLTGGAIAVSGLSTWALWAGATLMAAGLGVGIANTLIQTRFQSRVAPELQGRVFSLVGACMVVGQPLGLLLTAPLTTVVGVRGGMAVCGAALFVLTLVGRRGLNPSEIKEYSGAADDTLALPLLAESS